MKKAFSLLLALALLILCASPACLAETDPFTPYKMIAAYEAAIRPFMEVLEFDASDISVIEDYLEMTYESYDGDLFYSNSDNTVIVMFVGVTSPYTTAEGCAIWCDLSDDSILHNIPEWIFAYATGNMDFFSWAAGEKSSDYFIGDNYAAKYSIDPAVSSQITIHPY